MIEEEKKKRKFALAIAKAQTLWEVILKAEVPSGLGRAIQKGTSFNELSPDHQYLIAKIAVTYSKQDENVETAFEQKWEKEEEENAAAGSEDGGEEEERERKEAKGEIKTEEKGKEKESEKTPETDNSEGGKTAQTS